MKRLFQPHEDDIILKEVPGSTDPQQAIKRVAEKLNRRIVEVSNRYYKSLISSVKEENKKSKSNLADIILHIKSNLEKGKIYKVKDIAKIATSHPTVKCEFRRSILNRLLTLHILKKTDKSGYYKCIRVKSLKIKSKIERSNINTTNINYEDLALKSLAKLSLDKQQLIAYTILGL